ncbi:hypothetical protein T439DRAFT_308996 [Meredithblackwellia eburnea MCA 4105]
MPPTASISGDTAAMVPSPSTTEQGESHQNLEKFWQPPPPQAAAIPLIRQHLPNFESPPLRVSRVGQLDGALLDQELESILVAPVWKAMDDFRGPGRRKWEPELLALLRVAILKMSLWERGATYGSSLQNLKYRNEHKHSHNFQSTAVDSSLTRTQKTAYMVLTVLPAYLHSRLRDRMMTSFWSDEPLPQSWLSLVDLRRLSRSRRRETGEDDGEWRAEWKRVVWEIMSLGERIAAIAALANFLIFLYNGRFRTLIDRILGMRLVYAERSTARNVSFEFLNRQLVWEAFTEFLLFLMPLINVHRLRTRLTRLITNTTTKSTILGSVLKALPAPVARTLGLPTVREQVKRPVISEGTKPGTRPQGAFHFLSSEVCPVCYAKSSAPPPPTSLPLATAGDPGDPSSSAQALASLSSSMETTTSTTSEDTRVKIPYVTDCGWGCRYCYYCIVEKLVVAEEDGEKAWECMRCGQEARGANREVVEYVDAAEEETDQEEKEEKDAAKEDSADR